MKKKNSIKEIIRKILLVICIITFLGSGFYLAKIYYDGYKVQKAFKELEEAKEYDLSKLKDKNADTFGWVKIPDSKISYPVMFTPTDPEFYLRRNFEKQDNMAGTPFLDGYTDFAGGTKHMVIYGHHMKDGTMFNDLINYDDEEYAKKHDIIELEQTDGSKKKYKVFAFGKTDALSEGFNVYDYINIYNERDFNTYINGLKSLSKADTGITPTFSDNIITLSTCSYHLEEGRYVVSAVEIKE